MNKFSREDQIDRTNVSVHTAVAAFKMNPAMNCSAQLNRLGAETEEIFDDADRLVIDRPNARQHVSFGYGIHRCMGNRLAELQLRVLWEEIQQRFRMVEVVGPVKRTPNNFIRGIAELPVQLRPL